MVIRPTLSKLKAKFGQYKRLFQFQQQLEKNEEILIVHQMGKVGSSSVLASLEKHFNQPILHTHFLNQERLNAHLSTRKNKGLKISEHLKIAQSINQKIPNLLSNRKWKVITLVREPIARNISAYFQNLDQEHIKNCLNQYQDNIIELEEIINYFFQNYSHDIPLKWLDWEIKNVFGIDVYQPSFIPQKGYQLYSYKNIDLLLIRLESLSECWNEAIEKLSISQDSNNSIQLQQYNIGKDKKYSNLYTEFIDHIKIPESYVEKMYNSQYAKQFYNEQEIKRFTQYWLN